MYEITQTPDGYGGGTESMTLAVGAPTYATVLPSSGSMVEIAGMRPINSEYTIYVNKVAGFTWQPNMVVYCPAYGYMQLQSIQEDLNTGQRGQNLSRKRMIVLGANQMEQDQWQALLA